MKKIGFALLLTVIFSASAAFAETDFDRALRRYADGKYAEAVRLAKKYAEEHPEPSAYYFIGYALYNLGRHDEASLYFKDAYLIDPEYLPDELLAKIEKLSEGKKRPGKAAVKKPKKKRAKKSVARKKPKAAKPSIAAVKPPAPAPVVPAPEKAAVAEAVAPTLAANAAAVPAQAVNAPVAAVEAPEPAVPEAPPAAPVVPKAPLFPIKPGILPPLPGVLTGFLASIGIFILIIPVALYLYFALCLFVIARKLDTPGSWTAFIPLVQLWAIVGSAGKPWWWIVLMLVPLVNIIVLIYLWMLIAGRLGRSRILGILMILPLVNLLILGILAVSKVKAKVPSMGLEPSEFEPSGPSEFEEPGGFGEAGGGFPGGEEFPGFPGEEEKKTPEGGFESIDFGGQPSEQEGASGFQETQKFTAEPSTSGEFTGTTRLEAPGEEFKGLDVPEMPSASEPPEEEPGVSEFSGLPDIPGFPDTAESKETIDFPGLPESPEETSGAAEFPGFPESPETPSQTEPEPSGFRETVEFSQAPESPGVSRFGETIESSELPGGGQESAQAAPLSFEPGEAAWEGSPEFESGGPSITALSGIGELFGKTWEVYKKRLLTLVLTMLLAVVVAVVPAGIFMGAGFALSMLVPSFETGFIVGGGVVAAVAVVIAIFLGQGAFMFAVADRQLGVKGAFGRAWQRLGSFIWVSCAVGYILAGGFMLFFVPGVLFAVWFAFGLFVFVTENEKGMNALLKSKEYVGGKWADVFLRLLVVWLVSFVLSMVPIAGPILSFLFTPFMMLYVFLLYEELRALKGEVSFNSSTERKAKFIVLATLGYILIPLAIIALLGAAIVAPFLALIPRP